MDHFWLVTLFQLQATPWLKAQIDQRAHEDYGALGIEEFSMDESRVDEILGERSYSGGDLPESVISEVEAVALGEPFTYRIFFDQESLAQSFAGWVRGIALSEVQVEACQNEDWNTEWKKHYQPIRVNDKLEVVPAWMTDFKTGADKKIFINPGMGFGTGSHETTFLCLKLLTEEILNFPCERILDFGSGSGILGLAALLYYPRSLVDFYDIDPEANRNCYHNAEINGLGDRSFRLLLPSHRSDLHESYHLIFANILEGVLLEERESLVGKTLPGGFLILSGLLKHQMDGVVAAYAQGPVELLQRAEKGDWGALLLRRMV